MPDTLYLISTSGQLFSNQSGSNTIALIGQCRTDFTPAGLAITYSGGKCYLHVLMNLNGSTSAINTYNQEGKFLRGLEFASNGDMIGLTTWPGSSSLLVSTAATGLRLLSINDAAVTVKEIATAFVPEYGIAAANPALSNPTTADFFVAYDQKLFRLNINRILGTATAETAYCRRLHPDTTSLTSSGTGAYGIHIVGGGSTLHLFTHGIPTTATNKVRKGTFPRKISGLAYVPTAPGPGTLVSPPSAEVSTIEILTRLYRSDGTVEADVSGLNFGAACPGNNTDVACIDLLVKGVKSISNVKLGLMSVSGATYSQFKVSNFDTFDPSEVPAIAFSGLSDGTAASANNVAVGTKIGDGGLVNSSNYVYLMGTAPAASIETVCGCVYRWFFDYED
jgi:hypothetical protein